ncbi:hypothetical protein BS614_26250 [Paenibacillus xylanexedens]|uniref:cyclic peptide export ABC transporter n=1 Tax=Paenibacillus xylanexedens TaxID=528191 RepID=UPI000938592F|nr:cyclic peptide export ABC transporter [Paenibacillus xylanexedens]APO47208.1 hypothetical protein BS614_26250 [Paenibacillus xylanexedens]
MVVHKRKLVLCVLVMLMIYNVFFILSVQANPLDKKEGLIGDYIRKQQKAAKIPGIAVIVVQGNEIKYQHYSGYSDIDTKTLVTGNTLFEMGSNTKAFTGLAILQLEKQKLIKLTDPVEKYLPWFYMNYKGKKFEITIDQLLHHTSSIPPETIGEIPVSVADNALEQTVRMLVGKELWQNKNMLPGEYFMYSTINYDILGLIIQQVSGLSFEEYMQENIINSLGLESTYMKHDDAVRNGLATGYKLGFFKQHAYNAPRFRGNVPAGYLNSSPADIAKWMHIQLGSVEPIEFDPELIKKSHQIDGSVAPDSDGSSYASGWSVYQSGGGEISHGGTNPNFSSFIVMRKDEKLGVAVMGNLNSDYTAEIANGVMSIMRGRTPVEPLPDTYSKLDKISSVLLVIIGLVILIVIYLIIRCLKEVINGDRCWTGIDRWQIVKISGAIFFLFAFLSGLYYLPKVLLFKLPWSALNIWAPFTLVPAIGAAATFGVVYAIYHILMLLFQKKGGKPYITLLMLGMISGFGNAYIIFVINQTFGKDDNLTSGLLFYFALGILMYVYGQRYISTRLVALTNNLVYEKRSELITRILKTPYEKLEKIESGRLYTVLNNDTENVSRSVNVVVSGVISSITLICCFIYLALLNIYALILSMIVILVVVGLYFWLGSKAEKLWDETREIQTVFFRLVSDMLHGFKELRLSRAKNQEFKEHLNESSNIYRIKRTEGDIRFANVNVVGELLFTVVIGTVAFFFPIIFPNLLTKTVQTYVFVFLYITGPVNGILNAYPMLLQIRISLRRIQDLSAEISQIQDSSSELLNLQIASDMKIELLMQNTGYSYGGEESGQFVVGPFNLKFQSGTVTFITGGNGSGKTTLAKLITGLYKPTYGDIYINGKIVAPEHMGEYFSAIFSDYYLFERLYGINCSQKEERIATLLHGLQLEDKVTIRNGHFSTTSLSTGQKKRLALLLAYLEDKPICLFDEWAADQDPEFRRHFYYELLPEFKSMGKCIIVISHDDRYFHCADFLIQLERGRLVN